MVGRRFPVRPTPAISGRDPRRLRFALVSASPVAQFGSLGRYAYQHISLVLAARSVGSSFPGLPSFRDPLRIQYFKALRAQEAADSWYSFLWCTGYTLFLGSSLKPASNVSTTTCYFRRPHSSPRFFIFSSCWPSSLPLSLDRCLSTPCFGRISGARPNFSALDQNTASGGVT